MLAGPSQGTTFYLGELNMWLEKRSYYVIHDISVIQLLVSTFQNK